MLMRLVAVGVLVGWSSIAAAADPAVAQLEAFIKKARAQTGAVKHVYYDSTLKTWNRTAYSVQDVDYDVVKTKSLANPLAGTVAFTLLSAYADFQTKEEARAAVLDAAHSHLSERIVMMFSYHDGVWRFESARSSLGVAKGDIMPADIAADVVTNPASSYNAWVPWLTGAPRRR
jgi:hypothetical protein